MVTKKNVKLVKKDQSWRKDVDWTKAGKKAWKTRRLTDRANKAWKTRKANARKAKTIKL